MLTTLSPLILDILDSCSQLQEKKSELFQLFVCINQWSISKKQMNNISERLRSWVKRSEKNRRKFLFTQRGNRL